MITLHIDEPVPSENTLRRKHWRVIKANRDRWAWLVRIARLDARVAGRAAKPAHLKRAAVRIERYGKRTLDYDNFVAGAKALLDALVTEGFIVDDKPANVTVTYLQHRATPECTVVTIIEAA